MSSELVKTRTEILLNFKTLKSYRNSSNKEYSDYYKPLLRKGKVFIVEIINGKVEFAPSKFLGYVDNNKAIHEKLKNDGRSGIETDDQMKPLYGKPRHDDNLDQLLNYFYEVHVIDGSPYKKQTNAKFLFSKSQYQDILKLGRASIPFFRAVDIIKYSKYGGEKYRKDNVENVINGKQIRDKLYRKTNHWGEISKLNGFEVKTTLWQIGGHFIPYTWAKIFKKGDENKSIYFTVGIQYSTQALIYKLDCQSDKSNISKKVLSPENVKKFREYIEGSGAEWQQINVEELNNYDWEKLSSKTKTFIQKYEKLYDDTIEHIWGSKKQRKPKKNIVTEGNFEDLKYSIGKSFNLNSRTTKTDWANLHKESSALGTMGEEYVVKAEKENLVNKGKTKLADKVEHTSVEKGDGYGYDIVSFDDNGNEIYIEVKTTMTSCSNPIYISRTELEVSKEKLSQYFLYRVYNFNKFSKQGDIRIVKGAIDESLLEVDGYKGRIK